MSYESIFCSLCMAMDKWIPELYCYSITLQDSHTFCRLKHLKDDLPKTSCLIQSAKRNSLFHVPLVIVYFLSKDRIMCASLPTKLIFWVYVSERSLGRTWNIHVLHYSYFNPFHIFVLLIQREISLRVFYCSTVGNTEVVNQTRDQMDVVELHVDTS
jgi:hypothetical protein